MNLKIIKNLFPEEYKRISQGRCPFCDESIDMESFKDESSLKEFKISGICYECQLKTFET